MIKPLEDALATIANLPESEQEIAAELLQQFAARNGPTYGMDESERTGVREGFLQSQKGEFAPEVDSQSILRRPWR